MRLSIHLHWLSILLILCLIQASVSRRPATCRPCDFFRSFHLCHFADSESLQSEELCAQITSKGNVAAPRFIFYDVNAFEGFNLRRDVYIRMAVFVRELRQMAGYENTLLVLPPFHQLYHWQLVQSTSGSDGDGPVFWSHFFDLPSMRRFTEVIDLWQYFDLMQTCFGHQRGRPYRLDHVFKLKHFESMFSSGKFEEKFQVSDACDATDKRRAQNQFIGLYSNFSISKFECIEFQGSAMLLVNLLKQYPKSEDQPFQAVAFLNAETVLHDQWGNHAYWEARRSMRFSKHLVSIANAFRRNKLNSTDVFDHVRRPADWRHENRNRTAIGGNYLCAHLRRADFLQGRESTTPSLRAAATQIKSKANAYDLDTVFISSDCTGQEYRDLKSGLPRLKVVKFTPASETERIQLKPGGIAIIDQIICSHARFFIGTFESTFTYRIYEEREIMGFATTMTFNTFCKTHYENSNCQKNPVWSIAS